MRPRLTEGAWIVIMHRHKEVTLAAYQLSPYDARCLNSVPTQQLAIDDTTAAILEVVAVPTIWHQDFIALLTEGHEVLSQSSSQAADWYDPHYLVFQQYTDAQLDIIIEQERRRWQPPQPFRSVSTRLILIA